MKKPPFDFRKITIYIALVVLFFLLMGLSTRFNELTKLTEQNNLMQTEVAALKITEYAIETQIAYATSEIAVEEYARFFAGITRMANSNPMGNSLTGWW